MSARAAVVLGVVLLASPAAGEPRRLAEVEALGASGISVRQAAAELERSRHQLAQRRTEAGFEAFGSVTAGWYRNIIDIGEVNSYPAAGVRAGLRHPLFGSAARRGDAIASAENEVRRKEAEQILAARNAVLLLRRSYVNYWEAETQIAIADAFLASESLCRAVLAAREEPGLVLASDRLEFLTGFDLARRAGADARRRSDAAVGILERLTGSALAGFTPLAEPIAALSPDAERFEAELLVRAPELVAQDEAVRTLEQRVQSQRYAGVEGNAFLGGGVLPTLEGDVGSTVEAGVELRFPVSVGEARSGRRGELAADLELARLRRESLRERLRDDWRAAVGEHAVAREDLAFAARRVDAAQAALRERSARAGALDGDVLENLMRARFLYYSTASDALRAQARAWAAVLELASYEADLETPFPRTDPALPAFDPAVLTAGLDRAGSVLARAAGRAAPAAPRPPPEPAPRPTADTFGTYLWDSASVLGAARDAALARLGSAGVSRLLLSLDGAQIDRFAADPGVLDAFLAAAHARRLRVELLLGEPSWILPAGRADLVAIVRRLAGRNFDGLHLDLEVEQLPDDAAFREEHVAQWLDSVDAVAAAAPWPLSLSTHWRHLAADASGPCVACRLRAARVENVSLMIYASDPERVAAIARPILDANPALSLSVALSVEPELSAGESYAAGGVQAFASARSALRARLDAPNFGGLLVQSWKEYERWVP